MEEPFAEIVRTYGEQAAYSAADYLFLQRSLSDSLRGLEYPETADPVAFEQARSSYRWAMNTTKTAAAEDGTIIADRVAALNKLAGITNRLVVSPARNTVENAVAKAGTRYARVPEPAACSFCLMLGSRGAVYSKKTVLKDSGMGKYHDNCRCLGIECEGDHDLPKINQELQQLWKDTADDYGDTPTIEIFGEALHRQRDGTTPPWIPIDARRINQAPGKDRGPLGSVLSVDEIEQKRLYGTPSTLPDTPRNAKDQKVWDQEQKAIDWLYAAGARDIRRVGLGSEIGEPIKTPDIVIDGQHPTDIKTVGVQRMNDQSRKGAKQSRQLVFDVRGDPASAAEIDSAIRRTVRNEGDRLDRILVITDQQPYIWER
jgi:hypothetical protein